MSIKNTRKVSDPADRINNKCFSPIKKANFLNLKVNMNTKKT